MAMLYIFNKGINKDRVEPDPYSSYTKAHFLIEEKQLNTFQSQKIEKFRVVYDYNPREPISEPVINEKKVKKNNGYYKLLYKFMFSSLIKKC